MTEVDTRSAGAASAADAGEGPALAEEPRPGRDHSRPTGSTLGRLTEGLHRVTARARLRHLAPRPARRLLRRPGLLLAFAVIALVLVWGLAPQWFTGHDPLTGVTAEHLQGPSAAHWFGTDYLGRDLFARVVHGTALSLKAALLAVGIAFVAGSLAGVSAGFAGGLADDLVMRAADVLLAIPGLLLSLSVVAVLGFGTVPVAIAVGTAAIAVFAKVARAEVLRVRHADFVEAARASGVRWPAVLARHVLPNAAGPVLALAALEFGSAILAVSALSFLGFGAEPPTPEWGSLVAEGRDYLATSWWLTTLPGLVIVAVVLSANRIARAIDTERRPSW